MPLDVHPNAGYTKFPRYLRLLYRALQRVIVLEGVSVMVAETAAMAGYDAAKHQVVRMEKERMSFYSQRDEAPYCEGLLGRIDDTDLYCFAVESNNRLLSFAWFCVGQAGAEDNYGRNPATATAMQLDANAAFVFHAYTAPSVRGQTLMAGILAEAGRWLKQKRSVSYLVATTELTNDAARKAFAKAGFAHASSYWRYGLGKSVFGWFPRPTTPIRAFGGAKD